MGKLRYVYSNEMSGRPYCRKVIPAYRTRDNTCAVLDGTRVIFASETERFTKEKHDFQLPLLPLDAFLKTNPGVDVEDYNKIQTETNHHFNHIYEAFYQSGFNEAAVIVNDGMGTQKDCITLSYMQAGNPPVVLKRFSDEFSPCRMYNLAASRVFAEHNSEGKLMGLAAHGKDNGKTYISFNSQNLEIVTYKEKLLDDLADHHMRIKQDGVIDAMEAKDVAFTIQKNFEDTLVQVVKLFSRLLEDANIKTENLCLSGGGILNCPTNSKVVDLGLFKNYYASPQPNDGCAESIGRAFRKMELVGESLNPLRLKSAYLGAVYSAETVPSSRFYLEQPFSAICDFLKRGCVIAWCQDGAEYGPRALGHRSFLADPTNKDMLDALNKIKGREWWRPLAPIVPEELFTRIFEVENTDMCEFMLRTLKIKERWQPRLQAVCHVDGTTRPQLLKRDVNPQLYDLLMEYFEETHVPCLVNTSLNINGFPIVETPRDFCNLLEEVQFMENVPEVKGIFVEGQIVYQVCPEDLRRLNVQDNQVRKN